MNKHNWTQEEENKILGLIENGGSMHQAEKVIGMNRNTIKRHIMETKKFRILAKERGFFRHRREDWTEKEINFISRHLVDMDIDQLAENLGRTRNAVLKAIRVNKIRIARKILSVTIDLEEQLEEVEKRISSGELTNELISERNRLNCAIESRKTSCKSLKNKLVKTIAILK